MLKINHECLECGQLFMHDTDKPQICEDCEGSSFSKFVNAGCPDQSVTQLRRKLEEQTKLSKKLLQRCYERESELRESRASFNRDLLTCMIQVHKVATDTVWVNEGETLWERLSFIYEKHGGDVKVLEAYFPQYFN